MKSRFSLPAVVAVLFALITATGVLFVVSVVQEQVEESVRRNFVAAGTLARVQLHGERMRRFEKEMFIYVTNPKKRAEYAATFDASARDLLIDLDLALQPGGRSFNDAQRKSIAAWKDAALFYMQEFDKLVRYASRLDDPQATASLELKSTLDFNGAIGPGKDRLRELLKGAEEMRLAKEKSSMQIAGEIDREFALLFAAAAALAALALLIALGWPILERMISSMVVGRRPAGLGLAAPTRH